MNINEYIKSGILEQYCLGLISEMERAEVERVAARYPEVREHLRQMCKGLESYAEAHAIPPPKHLRSKVVEAIGGLEESEAISRKLRPAAPKSNTRSLIFGVAASIAMLVLAGMAYQFYQNQEKARKELAAISQQVQRLQKNYENLNNSHQELQAEYVLLKDVGTHHVQMQGSEHAPKAQCVVYWNPEHKGAYLNIIDLPPPPHGHAYQMWADVEGHHHNMGMLNLAAVSSDTSFLHPLPYIENSKGFVITLEKQEGSIHPTVEKLFVKGNL